MLSVLEQKRELLDVIIHCKHGLGIETLFGQSTWDFFKEQLHGNAGSIVVCGNGPVAETCRRQKEIDESQLVFRCNDYLDVFRGDAARKAVGSKCDVQCICLHGSKFREGGVQFLRDWCPESSIVLALENTKARVKITQAVKDAIMDGNELFKKINFIKEDLAKVVFAVDCTRGFYAIAFALQARRRLSPGQPVKCIGFGRRGHHNNPKQLIQHQHSEELLLFVDLWKSGDELLHLEWADHSKELIAHASRTNFLHCCPLPPPASSAFQHQESIETANASLQAVMALACTSSYYKCVAMDTIQAMVGHGLIVHPERKDYLTCKHHHKQGRPLLFQSGAGLMAHFTAKHSNTWASPDPSQSQPAQELPALELPVEGLGGGVWAVTMAMPRSHPERTPPVETMASVPRFQVPSSVVPRPGNVVMPPEQPFNIFVPRPHQVTVTMVELMRSYALFQHAAQIFSDVDEDQVPLPCLKIHLGANCVSSLDEVFKGINAQPAKVKEVKTTQGAGWLDIITSLNFAFENGHNKTIAFRGSDEKFTAVLAAFSNLMKQIVDNLLSLGHPIKTHLAVMAVLSFNWTCEEVEAKAIANIITGEVGGVAVGVKFLLSGINPHNKYTGRTLPSAGQSSSSSLPSQVRRAATIESDHLGPKRPRA